MTEIVARKYTIELRESPYGATDLVTILENAFSIAYVEAVNEAPTLKFDLPADDAKATNITKANEIWLRNYDTGALVNRFRLAKKGDKRGKELVTSVSAEGIINQLADELVTDYTADDLTVTQIVTALLAFQVLTPEITVGTINPTVSRSMSVSSDTILKALYRLQETVGSYIYLDENRALQWRTSIGENTGQQIRYQKNLKGITREIDYTTLANRLYAYGEGEGDARIKLSDVEGQEVDYIEDGDSQTEWGGIYPKVIVDKSITHPDTLMAWATLRLAELKDPRITYRVDAVDLSESIAVDFSFEKLLIGSTIKVIDEDLGIDVSAQVLKITHSDLLHPERMAIEVANRTKNIADTLAEVYDTQQLSQHIATTIGAGQVIVRGTITVSDWATDEATTIRGDRIETGTIVLTALDFIPLSSSETGEGATDKIVATINASGEGIRISADMIAIAAGRSIFKQAGIPTSISIGDLWFDTDDNNRVYRAAAIGADEVTPGEWELVRDTGIAAALADAATALEVADGEIVGYYQDAEPGAGMSFGDIWIDTDGHDPPNTSDIYRYEDVDGGSQGALDWRAAATNAIGIVYLNAYGAQSTADGKIVTFYQDETPIPTGDLGDLWINTTDSDSGKKKLYRAMSDGSDQITAGEWELVGDADIATSAAWISVNAEDILIAVSEFDAGGRVTLAEAEIVVNATAIGLRLLETDFTGTNIVAEINLTGSGVRITGDSITLDGDTLCMGSFEVQGSIRAGATLTAADGSVIIDAATGITIKGNKLILQDSTGANSGELYIDASDYLRLDAWDKVKSDSIIPYVEGASHMCGIDAARWHGYFAYLNADGGLNVDGGAINFDLALFMDIPKVASFPAGSEGRTIYRTSDLKCYTYADGVWRNWA